MTCTFVWMIVDATRVSVSRRERFSLSLGSQIFSSLFIGRKRLVLFESMITRKEIIFIHIMVKKSILFIDFCCNVSDDNFMYTANELLMKIF